MSQESKAKEKKKIGVCFFFHFTLRHSMLCYALLRGQKIRAYLM